MSISPFTKVQYDPPPSLLRAEEFIPETSFFEMEMDAGYIAIAESIFRSVKEDINQFQYFKRIALNSRGVEIKDLTNLAAKRVVALKTLHDMVRSKHEYLEKNKMRIQSSGMVHKAMQFLLREVKTLSSEFGQDAFYHFVCKELDARLPKLDEMIDSEVESIFPESK